MNTVVNEASLEELLTALAGRCVGINPLEAGQEIPATADLIEALYVLEAWIPSFGIVLREARGIP